MGEEVVSLGSTERVPSLISGTGVFLGAVVLGEVLVILLRPELAYDGFGGGVVTSLPFIGGLVYGGYWLARSDIPPDRYAAVARWWIAGLLGTAVLILLINVSIRTITPRLITGTVRWAGAIGGCIGLVIGVSQARAIQRAVEADQARRRHAETERERDRLEEFASIVSHDLRSPLAVARGHLDLLAKERESPHIEEAASALDRMESIIEDTLTLARAGQSLGETGPVELSDLASACWRTVETTDATLHIDETTRIEADEDRLRHLFENLFRNAIDHGGADVTVRVGVLGDTAGFYVEDDGPGIPESEYDQVFERGFSGSSDGTGFGLSIVESITEAHGWEISVTESADGGARFEVTGVTIDE